jgi:tetratricopeptide (TPR) repeat protein
VDKRTELFFKAYLWELVEPLYQRPLIIREEVLGKDNLDMATSLNNLAASYKSQGKYPEAEPLYQRALSILDTSFPNGHPNLDVIQANYQDLKSKMN